MFNDRRRAYQVGNPPSQENPGTESRIPDWAYTIHPREIAFYGRNLKILEQVNCGISAIARILIHSQVHEETQGELDWVNDSIRYGLHQAIEILTDEAASSIEFLQERAAKYRPAEDCLKDGA